MPAFALTEFAVVHTANEKVVAGFQQKQGVQKYSLFLFMSVIPFRDHHVSKIILFIVTS